MMGRKLRARVECDCPDDSVSRLLYPRADRIVGASLVLAVATLPVACGPRVSRFTVQPQILCAGDSAVADWEANGKLAMRFELEPAEPEGDCSRSGLDVIAVTLVARKGGEEAPKKVEIGLVHPSAAERIAFATTRIEDGMVVASGEKSIALWGSRLEIVGVSTCGGRQIQVVHAARSASLDLDGSLSPALAGTPLGGLWELRSRLTPAEQQAPSLRPRLLAIRATLRCRVGAP